MEKEGRRGYHPFVLASRAGRHRVYVCRYLAQMADLIIA